MTNASYDVVRQKVLDACNWLSQHGYFGSLRGSGGNVSVRIDHATMAVTPSGMRYDQMRIGDICVVDYDGGHIDVRQGLRPSMETQMHGAIYKNRPEACAVVHTHPVHGSVFAILNHPIPPLFDEVCLSLGPVIDIVPYAFSGSPELAANVAMKVENGAYAYIIQNHGVVTLGNNLDEAILHTELMEKVARIYALALATGQPVTRLPDDSLQTIASMRDA